MFSFKITPLLQKTNTRASPFASLKYVARLEYGANYESHVHQVTPVLAEIITVLHVKKYLKKGTFRATHLKNVIESSHFGWSCTRSSPAEELRDHLEKNENLLAVHFGY